ncbi:hypothetical protein AQUCO_05500130v1 [Aquilegia coerulea]|uniref:Exonuclease 1 n=1 Tax=Aquilegia coerulea TaxID=218851 RepID=A0A2G5CH59_AQUCA|nr:hypothetical protein AQUCO_05500130v1 [Aquilegia coerulea]
MGIQGLLPLLKSIMIPIHIEELRGCSVAVDTYSWLHKGALSCSKQLCKGEPTTRHIDYCMHRVNLLRHHGVTPVLVFDGGYLPMKSEEEIKRSRARKENLQRAVEHESLGNSKTAYECYQKAVDISPSVAYELIQVLKKENIDYVVAPYEADAQMTFLALSKHVDAVITEDSDLIPFGCPRIVFKMDKYGQGVQFQYSMLHQNKELNFTGFTKRMLLEMCILSGCDYLQSLPGMGLRKAHALIQKFKSYDKVIKHLKYNTVAVPPLYEESFKKALWAFQHQRVYNPAIEDIVHLTDIPFDLFDDLDFLGPSISQDLVKGIARGDINPITKMPIQGEIVQTGFVVDRTYIGKEFKHEKERKPLDLPAKKNVLTNYFCTTSLEAKRKFRAPRITPNHFDLMEGSDSSSERNESDKANKDSETCNDCSPAVSMEDGFASTVSLPLESSIGNLRSSEHSVPLELTKLAVCKPCPTLRKERECKLTLDVIESKTRSVNKKVIVRSSYFKHKSPNDNDKNKNEKPVTEKDTTSGIPCDGMSTESAPLGTNKLKSAMKKREAIPIERTQDEILKVKHARTDEAVPSERDPVGCRSTQMGTEEGNFGCNISHLSHYSNVAEKSMEKFVSIVSAFACKSSGSRASGLRAPLKDVNNTVGTRKPILPTDLGKFCYMPNTKKTASASHKV